MTDKTSRHKSINILLVLSLLFVSAFSNVENGYGRIYKRWQVFSVFLFLFLHLPSSSFSEENQFLKSGWTVVDSVKYVNVSIDVDSIIFDMSMPSDMEKIEGVKIFFNPIHGEFRDFENAYYSPQKEKLLVVSRFFPKREEVGDIEKARITLGEFLQNECASLPHGALWTYTGTKKWNPYFMYVQISQDYKHGKHLCETFDKIHARVVYCILCKDVFYCFSYYVMDSIFSFSYESMIAMLESIDIKGE